MMTWYATICLLGKTTIINRTKYVLTYLSDATGAVPHICEPVRPRLLRAKVNDLAQHIVHGKVKDLCRAKLLRQGHGLQTRRKMMR